MNEIQTIHAAFEFDVLGELIQNNRVKHLERICPAGVDLNKFNGAAAEYRTTYPQNNFVTERQVADICMKHGLVAGSLLAFSGQMPVYNRSQMVEFKLSDLHRVVHVNDVPKRIFANAMQLSRSIDRAYFEFSSGFVPADPNNPFRVIPVGDHFILLRIGDSAEYKIFYETIVHGSPWLVEFGIGSLQRGSIIYSWKQRFCGFEFRPGVGQVTVTKHYANVSLRLTIDRVQRANTLDLSVNVSPIVVAPLSMFARFGDTVEVSGYRVKLKASEILNNATLQLIDPFIVLQPVPFGYLVVTKFGPNQRSEE